MGRLGSFRPTRPLRMALATAVTASSWPMTRLCSVFSSFNSRSLSFSASFCTGILVHWATTSAISFSPILITLPASCFSRFFIRRSYFFTSASCCFLISAIWSNASMRIALSISWSISWIRSAISFALSGASNALSLALAEASSIRSMALSGRFLSLI